jgi:uncharacterized OsmC-like protein
LNTSAPPQAKWCPRSEGINGINVDNLLALIEGSGEMPQKAIPNGVSRRSGKARHGAVRIEGFAIGGQTVPRQFSIDIDEPCELGGSNRFANPQEHLLSARNACMMVGYVAQCAALGIALEKIEIKTQGEIDLRGFLGIDPAVPPGCDNLSYVVRIKSNDTRESSSAKSTKR